MKWLWPLLLAAMIFIASGRGEVASLNIVDFDKFAHFSLFGLLATLVARVEPRWRGWFAVVVVALFGLLDEWHQSFTPGRSVELADWVADTLGAVVATRLYAHWPLWRRVLERPLRTTKARVENPA